MMELPQLIRLPAGFKLDSPAGQELMQIIEGMKLLGTALSDAQEAEAKLLRVIKHAANCPSISCIHGYAQRILESYPVEPLVHKPEEA